MGGVNKPMKIVVYDDNEIVLDVIENIEKVEVENNNIYWQNGSIIGLKHDFIVLDDTVEIYPLTDETIALDRKHEIPKVDLAEENRKLKERLITTENALLDLMDRL